MCICLLIIPPRYLYVYRFIAIVLFQGFLSKTSLHPFQVPFTFYNMMVIIIKNSQLSEEGDFLTNQKIFLIPLGGLGNRMRFLETASVILKNIGVKKVHVIWIVNDDLHAKIEDLFNVDNFLNIHTLYTNNFIEKIITYGLLYLLRLCPFHYYADRNFNLKEYAGKRNFAIIEGSERLSDYNHLEFFKPKDNLLSKAKSILGDSPNIVGVHIRRTDHQLAISRSTDDLFDQIISNEISSGKCVYVSTDDTAVKKNLKTKYGDKIITYENVVLDRKSSSGMQDAVIEMLCLALCEKIYGSYGSTFSNVASYIYGKPKITVDNIN